MFSFLARAEEEAVDLGSLGLNDFTPYTIEREQAWILLPALTLAMVLLHLRKIRLQPRKKPITPIIGEKK